MRRRMLTTDHFHSLLALALFAGGAMILSGCASDVKPRQDFQPGFKAEGSNDANQVTDGEVKSSTRVPSTSVVLRDDPDASGMTINTPGSTSTAWAGPIDTWVNAAGIVRLKKVKAEPAEGGVFSADEIEIDNSSTLTGAAQYATAIEAQVNAMNEAQKQAFIEQVRANADLLKSISPSLFEMLAGLAGL